MRGETRRTLLTIAGALLYAIGINLFIVPAGFYSGGLLGIGQIVRTIIVNLFNIQTNGFDIAGIVVYLINIPLFILAYQKIGKKFFLRTVITVTFQTIFLTLIPTSIIILKGDPLASVIVGAVISGYGAGLILRQGSSGGGQDIIGVYMMKKDKNFSVGKISRIINVIVFTACLIMYDLATVIYSLIFVMIHTFVIDNVHFQNVNKQAIIVTKDVDVIKGIIESLERTMTIIDGKGSYTGEDYKMIYTVLSKYEANLLEEKVKETGLQVFMQFTNVDNIVGNYEKHL